MVDALEKLVLDQPGTGQTIDIYANGLVKMYSGMGGNPNAPPAWTLNPLQNSGYYNGQFVHRSLQGFDTPGGFQTTLPQYHYEPPKLPEIHYEPPKLPELGRPYGNLSPTNSDVLGRTYELDKGFRLGERFDFSGHDGSEPHLNYDIINPNGRLGSNSILKDEHLKNIWDKI